MLLSIVFAGTLPASFGDALNAVIPTLVQLLIAD
jgi:hypothetical protein